MVIVLIHWKIKRDCVDDFLTFWKTKACIKDRSGLVGEFLSEVQSEKDCEWIKLETDCVRREIQIVYQCGIVVRPRIIL